MDITVRQQAMASTRYSTCTRELSTDILKYSIIGHGQSLTMVELDSEKGGKTVLQVVNLSVARISDYGQRLVDSFSLHSNKVTYCHKSSCRLVGGSLGLLDNAHLVL